MRVRFDNDFKRYHTTTVSSPPMRQTKEQTDQTADIKEQKNQTNLMLFLGFLQPLCFCGETKWPWMNPGCAAQDWSVWFSVTWPHLGLHLWNCMWTAYNQSLRCAQTKKLFKNLQFNAHIKKPFLSNQDAEESTNIEILCTMGELVQLKFIKGFNSKIFQT